MKIKIRKATKYDVDILFELITKIAEHHNQEQYVSTNKEKLRNAGFHENPKYHALIAEVEDMPVGFLSYTWNYSIWSASEFMNLDDLFVLDDYRSKNIGLGLMDFAKNICKVKGVELIRWEVEQDNTKAIKFYQNLGADINVKGIFKWNLNS